MMSQRFAFKFDIMLPFSVVNLSFLFLLIVVPPSVLSNPVDLVALNSDEATFTCVVHGFPVPSVEWQKDGLPLQTDFSVSVNSSLNSQPPVVTSSLMLSSVTYEDSGNYFCVATNFLAKSISVSSLSALLTVNCE